MKRCLNNSLKDLQSLKIYVSAKLIPQHLLKQVDMLPLPPTPAPLFPTFNYLDY